jgi:dolichol-phosphate mannosyltransferase
MKKLISYIFPIYNEAENIQVLYRTISDIVGHHKEYSYEFIFINDASIDKSLDILRQIQSNDKRITVIDLSRNFGHQIAVTAGIDYARGDALIIMDSDMQDPPEVSLELTKKWEQGYDVVYAQRRSRQDTLFKKLTANIYYRLLHQVADIDIPRDTGDFRLIDRKVADQMRRFKEHNRFLRGMISFIGYKQTAVQFDRGHRHAGETGYPLRKMIKFAADGIFGFSTAPLRFITKCGYFIATLAFLGIIYALLMKVFAPQITIEGWTFIVISILLIGGVQIIMLGVVGSYIGRIFTEVQDRPLYAVKDIYPNESISNHLRQESE